MVCGLGARLVRGACVGVAQVHMECGRCLRPLGGQPHPDPRGGEYGQWRRRDLPGACALGGHGARGDLCRVPDCGEFPREQPHGDHHREKNKSQTVKNTRKSHRRRRELREERASSWNRFGCARSTLALNNAPFPPMLTCLNLFFSHWRRRRHGGPRPGTAWMLLRFPIYYRRHRSRNWIRPRR